MKTNSTLPFEQTTENCTRNNNLFKLRASTVQHKGIIIEKLKSTSLHGGRKIKQFQKGNPFKTINETINLT